MKTFAYKNQVVRTLTDNLFIRQHFATQSAYFKKALYAFIIFKAIQWTIIYPVLFGEHASALTVSMSGAGPVSRLAYLLYGTKSVYTGWFFIAGCFVISAFGLFNKRIYFLTDLILWILLINIHNKIYPTLTGGDYLLNQLALFNIFILQKSNTDKNWLAELKNCLHNFSCFALMLQICFVYFISGYAKLRDAEWLAGNAISLISHIDHYNLHSFRLSGEMANSLNYFVMFYQLLFPIIIWFRYIKKPLLIFGVLFHLYVAFAMGIVAFGIIMIIPYIYFWPVKNKN